MTLLAMADPWFSLALLRASVLTLVPMFFGLGWASLAVAGMTGPPRPHPDLLALGLDRAPSSWDELRKAYRSAARATHPDASGGSKEAFLAVAAAFERLSEKLGRRRRSSVRGGRRVTACARSKSRLGVAAAARRPA